MLVRLLTGWPFIYFSLCGCVPQIGSRTFILFRFPNHTLLDTHTHTIKYTCAHIRYDSSERVIGSSQRPLPVQHTTNTREEHVLPQPDSNPRSQHSNCCRPMPYTARPPGSAAIYIHTALQHSNLHRFLLQGHSSINKCITSFEILTGACPWPRCTRTSQSSHFCMPFFEFRQRNSAFRLWQHGRASVRDKVWD
jgi:hypothetical protein